MGMRIRGLWRVRIGQGFRSNKLSPGGAEGRRERKSYWVLAKAPGRSESMKVFLATLRELYDQRNRSVIITVLAVCDSRVVFAE